MARHTLHAAPTDRAAWPLRAPVATAWRCRAHPASWDPPWCRRAALALLLGGAAPALAPAAHATAAPIAPAPTHAPDRAGAEAEASTEDPRPSPGASQLVDRVVARWTSSATGGPDRPQFVLARALAFEARVEALAESYVGSDGYADKHVRAALRRHVTETMLAALPVSPPPTPAEIAKYAHAARLMAEQRVGSATRLRDAARAEGLDGSELDALWRRQARASSYLDRMVAPMLEPTDADLRDAFDRGELPPGGKSFTERLPELRRVLVGRRLTQALERYFRSAESRIVLRLIGPG